MQVVTPYLPDNRALELIYYRLCGARFLNDTGRCSGRFPYATSIVDTLILPEDLGTGGYVLQLRWDCEATAQVWTNCADIAIGHF